MEPEHQHTILSTTLIQAALKGAAAGEGILIDDQSFIKVNPIFTEEKRNEIINELGSGDAQSIVFTSQHAVRITDELLADSIEHAINKPIYCLAGTTLYAIQQSTCFNENRVAATAVNARELALKIMANKPKGPVVFFCGNRRRNELPVLLKENGYDIIEAVVYETVETPAVVKEAFDGILFFSPSAVHSFFSANNIPAHTACFAIGDTTAVEIRKFTGNPVITSEAPSQTYMLNAVLNHFKTNNQFNK